MKLSQDAQSIVDAGRDGGEAEGSDDEAQEGAEKQVAHPCEILAVMPRLLDRDGMAHARSSRFEFVVCDSVEQEACHPCAAFSRLAVARNRLGRPPGRTPAGSGVF